MNRLRALPVRLAGAIGFRRYPAIGLCLLLLSLACTSAPAAPPAPASSSAGPAASPAAAPPAASPAAAPPAASPAAAPTAAAPAAPARSGGKLTVAMNTEPDTLDQHVGSSRYNEFVDVNIYDRLIERASDGGLKPGLALTWEASSDGLNWTLKLRPGVKFHDGTPFNAQAVKLNFDRIKDPATKSQKAIGLIGPYVRTDVVDDMTVRLVMSQPYAPFLDALTSFYSSMQSPAAMEKWGADFGQHPVGTGPFIFEEWIPKDHITLKRNPDYNWAPEVFQHSGPAYLDEIVFTFVPEDATRVTTLDTGESDVIINTPPQDVARIKSDPKLAIVTGLVTGMPPSIIMNTERFPTDDLKVRQALNYATNQDAIVQTVFYGVYPRAYGPLTQANVGYDKKMETGYYSFDLAKAKALLDEAGWQPGPGGIRQKDGKPFKMVYIAFPGGTSIKTAELVQAQLKEVGADVEIRQLNNPANLTASQAGEHNLRWLNWLFSDPAELSTTFASANIGSGWNFARWKNSDLDSLLDSGRRELDQSKRNATYAQVQDSIMRQALIVPLYVGVQVLATKAEVKGIRMHPLGDTAMLYDANLTK